MAAMKAMKAMKVMKVMKAAKAMKTAKAMKAMKVMKAKRVSKRMAKVVAFRGGKTGGATRLTKADLVKNKDGRDVSRAEGSEGAWHQGLRGRQEGLAPLQQGARVLHPVIGRASAPPPAECARMLCFKWQALVVVLPRACLLHQLELRGRHVQVHRRKK